MKSTLSPDELQERLRLDYRVVMSMRSPVMDLEAYRNPDDLRAKKNPIKHEDDAHLATNYLVEYHIKTLVGPGRFSDKTTIYIDLLANGDYPFNEPASFVIEGEIPWSPVFKKGRPISTHMEWGKASGEMLFGQLLIRLAMLLNFAGLPTDPRYEGYNRDAIQYWRTTLNMQPITPKLVYPILPAGIAAPPLSSFISYLKKRGKQDKYQRSLRVFLCHSHGDKAAVRELYRRLLNEGFNPWLDEESLLPGQDWQYEITKAVQSTDVVIVCLSRGAVNKKGFVHTEIKQALDVADQQPEGAIFLIPLKLEECDIPERLRRWHWVNLFDEKGYEWLLTSLLHRTRALEVDTPSDM